MKKGSLADKISSILTTTPVQLDPEDGFDDDTKATFDEKVVEKSEEESVYQSQFRTQNIDLLDEVDTRYAGKGGSRKNFADNFDDNVHESSEAESDKSNMQREEFSENEDEEFGKSSDDSEFDESDKEYQDDSNNHDLEDSTNFKTLKANDGTSQVKKGICVKNQLNIWENLLEMRIQMQKCVVVANKMPHHERYKEIKKESSQDFIASVQKTKDSVSLLLEKLLLLQSLTWRRHPEMNKFQLKNHTNNGSDEEIPSDTEDEPEGNEHSDQNEENPKKKLKISDFSKELQNKHELYKEYRNSVIKKWHEKTRMPAMKHNMNVHSIINHIEHTLADKDKLVKRTRLKRSNYTIVGEESESGKDDSSLNETDLEKPVEEYNSEIFDDDDFYHQLLRELIEFKSSDITDPVQLGRQWIQLQNLRSKMKRKIDTKATKGRKIRYAVHTKLVNFMAPVGEHLWTDEAKTELFGSLFGKTQAAAT